MLKHVDLTANVERTPEELVHIMYSLDEINAVIDGYPELDDRLYVPADVEIPSRRTTLLGREVNIYEIPGGHDATNSSYRAETLASMTTDELLYGEPDPDLPTGGDWRLPAEHPTVRRALRDRCRDFTQHMQPLLPGWRALLALRGRQGQPLGMPTGIGWYTNYWLSKMCDGVTLRLSEARDDLGVLLYVRAEDDQSEAVWGTPGGYVIKADAEIAGVTPLQAASARRAADSRRTGRDLWAYGGVPLRVKYPISSGSTIVAGLETTPFARFMYDAKHQEDPSITAESQRRLSMPRTAGYVSLRALCAANPTGGVSGKGHADNPFPIWTTHFEYVTAGLDALTDPEYQFRFGMSDQQFADVQTVADDLRRTYTMLETA